MVDVAEAAQDRAVTFSGEDSHGPFVADPAGGAERAQLAVSDLEFFEAWVVGALNLVGIKLQITDESEPQRGEIAGLGLVAERGESLGREGSHFRLARPKGELQRRSEAEIVDVESGGHEGAFSM